MSSTSAESEFCDTNVLVYAYDETAGPKHHRARELVDRLWPAGHGVVSIQVLQELYVTLTGKVRPPLPAAAARAIVADLARWRVVEPGHRDVLDAIDGSARWRISFWDAMLLTMASKAGARVLWSEDLQNGRTYDGVLVRNPFR